MLDNDLCETPQPTQQSVLNRSSKDKFLLVLNLPLLLRKQSVTNRNISITPLQMSVRGTIVPAVRVPANEVRFAGQSYNVSSHARPNYEPLTVNFIVDNKFLNYWNLWYWLNTLNTARGSTYTGSNNKNLTNDEKIEQGNLLDYQANLSIFSLNEYNERSVEFIYYNAFITELGSINYNYEDSNIIETTATFQFSQLDMKITSNP
jgi:hypothetical protein